ncbi:MAG: DUF2282 domain-containing protein [Nitrospirae bacterium]|nr:DUF2282 domain-containing protein [Nitrospirota bacterium]
MNYNPNNKKIIQSALLIVLLLGGTGAFAAMPMPKVPDLPSGWEACGGVAKASMNDCAVRASLHSCVGQAKSDGEADSYLFLPKGACGRMVNGKVLAITKQDIADLKAMMMKKMQEMK